MSQEHGGDLDRAMTRFGGKRAEWLDLSTGINPRPYQVPDLPAQVWSALPDRSSFAAVEAAARRHWRVPDGAEIVIAPGASALIAAMPRLSEARSVAIPEPTYNEHAASFRAAGVELVTDAPVQVVVHPNNPDGRLWPTLPDGDLVIVDESFAETGEASHVAATAGPGVVVLKSFGKLWGLAGLRLGFAICAPEHAAVLRAHLGPWAASGPALAVGARALADDDWAARTRAWLRAQADALDAVMTPHAELVGGTPLFRLYSHADAAALQKRLAEAQIWTRTFSYDPSWIRLGLPPDGTGLDRIAQALG